MTYQLLALQLGPDCRDGAEIENGRGRGRKGGRNRGRADEVKPGTKDEGKEGGSEAGRRKRGSAPRYSINRGSSMRLCLMRKESLCIYRIIKYDNKRLITLKCTVPGYTFAVHMIDYHRASSIPGTHHVVLLYHIDIARQPVRHRGSRGVAAV